MATGLSLSGTSNLASGQKIMVASAIMAFEPSAPDPDLIWSKRIPNGNKQWDVNVMARLSNAAQLTEGTDLAQVEQLVAANVSVTPVEHGILANVSKELVRRQGDMDVMPEVGRMLGASLRRRQALDVIALYDGASKSTPGANTALNLTHVRGAYAYLLTDNDSAYGPAQLPLHGALHIEQISDIVADIGVRGTYPVPTGFSQELIEQWWQGRHRVYSMQFFHSGNLTRDSSEDSKGAIFNRQFAVMVMANEAEYDEQKDMSLRATEVGIFQTWSEKEVADPWAVEIYSDTAATI